ncbi:hypothetical protein JCM10213_006046 [Rhodosporidiobolus nylandii]
MDQRTEDTYAHLGALQRGPLVFVCCNAFWVNIFLGLSPLNPALVLLHLQFSSTASGLIFWRNLVDFPRIWRSWLDWRLVEHKPAEYIDLPTVFGSGTALLVPLMLLGLSCSEDERPIGVVMALLLLPLFAAPTSMWGRWRGELARRLQIGRRATAFLLFIFALVCYPVLHPGLLIFLVKHILLSSRVVIHRLSLPRRTRTEPLYLAVAVNALAEHEQHRVAVLAAHGLDPLSHVPATRVHLDENEAFGAFLYHLRACAKDLSAITRTVHLANGDVCQLTPAQQVFFVRSLRQSFSRLSHRLDAQFEDEDKGTGIASALWSYIYTLDALARALVDRILLFLAILFPTLHATFPSLAPRIRGDVLSSPSTFSRPCLGLPDHPFDPSVDYIAPPSQLIANPVFLDFLLSLSRLNDAARVFNLGDQGVVKHLREELARACEDSDRRRLEKLGEERVLDAVIAWKEAKNELEAKRV